MAGIFGVLMMACAGVLAAGCAINFFWRLGPKRSFAYGGFFVGVFLLFWASGLWEGASRHSWGVLAPIFALIMALVWLCARYMPVLIERIYSANKEKEGKEGAPDGEGQGKDQ